MARPLYKTATPMPALLATTAHAGLWYDKLCDRWSSEWALQGSADRDSKLGWIETVTKNPIGNENLLEEAILRTIRLTVAKRGVFGVLVNESRFVTGLGRSHPVENGFAWHPTLGVPYLPGSSVKGMLRAWAEQETESRASHELVTKAFGTRKAAGEIDVVDLLPIVPVRLEADVMTPHYAAWTPDNPPGDWRSPVPVPFLTTAAGGLFMFALLPRSAAARDLLETAQSWLLQALQFAGAGAKTSVGYGRFRLDEAETTKWRKRIEDENLAKAAEARRVELLSTPEGRWQLELDGKAERDILELVRVHLSKEPLADPSERIAFARAVAATGLPTLWKKGGKRERETQVGTTKLKERAKLVAAELKDGDA